MTVRELIAALQALPEEQKDLPVCIPYLNKCEEMDEWWSVTEIKFRDQEDPEIWERFMLAPPIITLDTDFS